MMRRTAVTFLAVAVALSLMVVSFAIYLSPRTSEVACVSTVYLAFLGNSTRSSVGTYTTATNSTAPVGRVMSTTLTPFSEGKQLYRIEETCTFVSK